jgi:hypothetical protein
VYERYYPLEGRIEQYRFARKMGLKAILQRQPAWIFEKLRDEMPRFWEADSLALIHIRRGAYGELPRGAAVAAWMLLEVPYLALLVAFVAGAAALRLERRTLLLLGFLALYNLLHVATHGFTRYRLPILPVLFLAAAYALSDWGGERYPALSRRRRVAAFLLAVVLAASVAASLQRSLGDPTLGSADPQDAPIDRDAR